MRCLFGHVVAVLRCLLPVTFILGSSEPAATSTAESAIVIEKNGFHTRGPKGRKVEQNLLLLFLVSSNRKYKDAWGLAGAYDFFYLPVKKASLLLFF